MKPNFEFPSSGENFNNISHERRLVRKKIKEGKILDTTSPIHRVKRKLDAQAGDFKIPFREDGKRDFTTAKKFLFEQKKDEPRNSIIDQYQMTKEIGNDFKLILDIDKKIMAFRTAILKNIQDSIREEDPFERRVLQSIIQEQQQDLENMLSERIKIIKQNPRIARAVELAKYKQQLHEEGGIILVPTVEGYIQEIEKKMITGRPVFLHGPTGTGKTSIARRAAEQLTGKKAEVVFCNEQTREADLYGRMGIDIKDGASFTKFILGKVARAVAEGKPIIFDEFNRLTSDQQGMIKGLFGYRPGDMVPITGNGTIRMEQGFQIICTANLKSEKHPDRQDLPNEMKREFRQNHLEVGYNPMPESYDIMIARLMNSDGSIELSWQDINNTLPKLAEAMISIQNAYSGELSDTEARSLGVLDASNTKAQLKSFVMTQGSISDILSQWHLEKATGISFIEFIDQRLVAELSFGNDEDSREDHILAAKIFALKGLLQTVDPEDIGLPSDIFNGIQIKKMRGDESAFLELIKRSKQVAHITFRELTDIDPFGVRESFPDIVDDFDENIPELPEDDFLKQMEKQFNFASGRDHKKLEVIDIHTAESILGSDFLGPDAIKQTFGFEVHKVPEIPFSQEEVERAKELGQQLVLYVDQTPDGKPLSIMGIHNLLNNTTSDGNKLLYDNDWYKNQAFAQETPQLGWKLTSKEVIPHSTEKNYLQQTETIIEYLTKEVFKGIALKDIPREYQDAVTEFNDKKTVIEGLISSDWKKAAEELVNLKITGLTRETPAEIMYRLALTEKTTKSRPLESIYSWSAVRVSGGNLVYLGSFASSGAGVLRGYSDNTLSNLGVCFSRGALASRSRN